MVNCSHLSLFSCFTFRDITIPERTTHSGIEGARFYVIAHFLVNS
ncbi:hypothetical protein QWZ13_03755 [Reinekea marina]|nr:hypothetical protein [Reinekea marina]MDN3648017.1 hypothetical protein [Reinekea marina]